MNNYFDKLKNELRNTQRKWLITGVAGFIGSNLLEFLLNLNQVVIGLDNFSTGFKKNLNDVYSNVGENKWANFHLIEGDLREFEICEKACNQVDYVLHQAALGSVPKSIENPLETNSVNINGYLNIIEAAKKASVKNFVYASSSSVYGDDKNLPKIESIIGNQLSPYAVTKYTNELYASVYFQNYNFNSRGLRYFNVFGKRQNHLGPYSAVIPRWIDAMLENKEIIIYGDGNSSRDFCYIENVVQANILAAIDQKKCCEVYNIAYGERNTLIVLFNRIKECLQKNKIMYEKNPIYSNFRKGDILHSHATIKKANNELNYFPSESLNDGIDTTINWYLTKKIT